MLLFFIRHPSPSTGGRTLQIVTAKEEDSGRYTCVATNEAGETLKHYEVTVYGEIQSFFTCVYIPATGTVYIHLLVQFHIAHIR